MLNHSAWVRPIDMKLISNNPTDREHVLEVAKTLVRANVIAPAETYKPNLAAEALLSLSEQPTSTHYYLAV